jgi:hypothetical protein
MVINQKLSNLQLELLQLFAYELSDKQLEDIKKLLAQYLADNLSQEMDKVWTEQNWSNELMDKWANEHWQAKS